MSICLAFLFPSLPLRPLPFIVHLYFPLLRLSQSCFAFFESRHAGMCRSIQQNGFVRVPRLRTSVRFPPPPLLPLPTSSLSLSPCFCLCAHRYSTCSGGFARTHSSSSPSLRFSVLLSRTLLFPVRCRPFSDSVSRLSTILILPWTSPKEPSFASCLPASEGCWLDCGTFLGVREMGVSVAQKHKATVWLLLPISSMYVQMYAWERLARPSVLFFVFSHLPPWLAATLRKHSILL